MKCSISSITPAFFVAHCCLTFAAETEPNPLAPPASHGADHAMEDQRLRPMWTISDYKLTLRSQWGAKEAQKWLFKTLEITPEAVRFNGKTCLQPKFTQEPMDRSDFESWTGGISAADLKVPEGTLDHVKTSCQIDALDQYVRLPDGRLVIQIHKVIFVLEPNINY